MFWYLPMQYYAVDCLIDFLLFHRLADLYSDDFTLIVHFHCSSLSILLVLPSYLIGGFEHPSIITMSHFNLWSSYDFVDYPLSIDSSHVYKCAFGRGRSDIRLWSLGTGWVRGRRAHGLACVCRRAFRWFHIVVIVW